MDFDIKSMGAVSDGKTKNTKIIQEAIDLCSKHGGRVVIADGTYLTGKLIMKSNVELHIAAGGVLLGSADYNDYPESENLKTVDSKMLPRCRNAALIFAESAENISITGMGKIDCSGESFVEKLDREPESHGWEYKRNSENTPPRVVFFASCKNVKVEDVTMVNQPAGWSYWIHACEYVNFTRVKILADVRYPNNDGIHINCSNDVTVTDSFITCGDDAIVIRANSVSLKENRPCERVCVSNCTLRSYVNCIRIGWINDGVIRNCVFSNLVMHDSVYGVGIYLPYRVYTNADIRIFDKSKPISTDVGREMTLIENLKFDNIIMDTIYKNPIFIEIDEHEDVKCKQINNIRFSNVTAFACKYPHFKGRETTPLGDIYFYNSSFSKISDGEDDAVSDDPMSEAYADRIHFINTEIN